MSTVTERLRLVIEASAKGAANEIRSVEAASGGAAQKTGLLQRGMDQLGVSGLNTSSALKVAGATVGVVAATKLAQWAAEGVEKFASLTSEVRGFQRVAGTSAEESSKLVFAVKELGISPDTAASAFGRLETRIGTGKANLEQYGIATKNAKGETLDASQIVANISDAYQNADSQSEKAAIGNEAFGRSWQSIAPLLGKGKADLQDLYAEAAKDHQIFSQQDLENGRKLTLATTQLKDAFTGLEVEIGSAVAPAVAEGTNALTQTIHTADDATSSVGGLGGLFKATASQFSAGGGVIAASSDLIKGHFSDAIGDMAKGTPVLGQVISLFDDGGDASNKYSDAQKRVDDATKSVANAIADHGAKSKEARDAENELTDASNALEGMQHKVSGALQDVNDKLETHAEKALAAAQADLVQSGAKLGLENAVANVSTALDNYNQTLVGNFVAQDGSAEAAGREAQAHRDVVAAVNAAVAAAGQKAIADNEGKSKADQTAAANNAMRYTLIQLEQEYPALTGLVQGYLDKLDNVPPTKDTHITISGTALGDATDIGNAVTNIPRTVEIQVIAKKAGDAWAALGW